MLNQIWSDDNYVYAATSSGLDIIQIESEQEYAHITYSGGFNTVWANDNRVYVGTSDNGIKYIAKTAISGSLISPPDLFISLVDYANYPTITSNYVRYIHGQENFLMCCTASGVNTLGVYGYKSRTTTPYAQKCFVADDGKIYYTTISGSVHAINRVNIAHDWTIPDEIYYNDGVVLYAGIEINDIYVYDSIIYAATSSGIYAIDDNTADFLIYFAGV